MSSLIWTSLYQKVASYWVLRSLHSFLSAEELLVLIPNIILTSTGNTLLVLVWFNLLYWYIHWIQGGASYVFSQTAWLCSSIQNFDLCFQILIMNKITRSFILMEKLITQDLKTWTNISISFTWDHFQSKTIFCYNKI